MIRETGSNDVEFAKQLEEVVAGNVMRHAGIHDIGKVIHGHGEGFVGHGVFDR